VLALEADPFEPSVRAVAVLAELYPAELDVRDGSGSLGVD
jgi:hypothetical protein